MSPPVDKPLFNLSPKLALAVVLMILAAVALALITGDKTYLIFILISLAGGGIGTQAKPVAGLELTTDEIQAELAAVVAERSRVTGTRGPPSR